MAMKIDGVRAGGERTIMPRESEVRISADTDFQTELDNQQSSMSQEEMERLLKRIDEEGERLSKTPTFEELSSYRDLIKRFVSEAVGQMYESRTSTGWDRLGRQKSYTTVRKIDEKLEEMAEKIRLGQTDRLDIIAAHGAIRGMLIDLYM